MRSAVPSFILFIHISTRLAASEPAAPRWIKRQHQLQVLLLSAGKMQVVEFQNALYDRLASNGTVDVLKAQLRARIVASLQHPIPGGAGSGFGISLRDRAMASLIAGFLRHRGLDLTRSVFLPESGLGEAAHSDSDAARALHIPSAVLVPDRDDSVLDQVMAFICRKGEEEEQALARKRTAIVQTSSDEIVIDPLSHRFLQIDSHKKMATAADGRDSAGVEQRLAALEIDMEERYRRQLSSEIDRMRAVDIQRVKMEESDKYRAALAASRAQLEDAYAKTLAELHRREAEVLSRADRLSREREAECHAMRQRLLEDQTRLESMDRDMRRREASVLATLREDEDRLRDRESEVSRLKDEVLKRIESETSARVARWEADHAAQVAVLERDRARVANDFAELQKLREERLSSSSELARLRQSAQEQTTRIALLGSEVELLRRRLEEAQQEASRLRGVVGEREAEVREYRSEVISLRKLQMAARAGEEEMRRVRARMEEEEKAKETALRRQEEAAFELGMAKREIEELRSLLLLMKREQIQQQPSMPVFPSTAYQQQLLLQAPLGGPSSNSRSSMTPELLPAAATLAPPASSSPAVVPAPTNAATAAAPDVAAATSKQLPEPLPVPSQSQSLPPVSAEVLEQAVPVQTVPKDTKGTAAPIQNNPVAEPAAEVANQPVPEQVVLQPLASPAATPVDQQVVAAAAAAPPAEAAADDSVPVSWSTTAIASSDAAPVAAAPAEPSPDELTLPGRVEERMEELPRVPVESGHSDLAGQQQQQQQAEKGEEEMKAETSVELDIDYYVRMIRERKEREATSSSALGDANRGGAGVRSAAGDAASEGSTRDHRPLSSPAVSPAPSSSSSGLIQDGDSRTVTPPQGGDGEEDEPGSGLVSDDDFF